MEKQEFTYHKKTEDPQDNAAEGEYGYEEEENPTKRFTPSRFLLWIIAIAITIGLIIASFCYRIYSTFDSYEVQSSFKLQSGTSYNYEGYGDGLLEYSKDGAAYMDEDGNLLWQDTYDMQNPTVVIKGDELLIYDLQGTSMVVLNQDGPQGEIVTALPIVKASVSENGQIGAIMQQDDTGYIYLYQSDGTVIASGEVHLENTGYPVSIAVSPDGGRLLVSMISLSSGAVSSTLNFYDFSDAGKEKKDNITATFSYADEIFPEVDFFADGSSVAFGENTIMLFNSSSTPEETSELSVKDELKSVFVSDSSFAVVDSSSKYGTLKVYRENGRERFSVSLKEDYSRGSFLKNGSILITNGENVSVYNKYGVRKFHYDFSDGILQVLSLKGLNNYLIVDINNCSRIRLK